MAAERHHQASDPTGIRRSGLLVTLGGALEAGLAGCTEVTSQEFVAAPVRLPEAVSEELGLTEVFTDSQTTTRERTVFHVTTPDDTTHNRMVTARSNFLSQNPRSVHIGLDGAAVERLRITWPDGHPVVHGDVRAGQRITVNYQGTDNSWNTQNPYRGRILDDRDYPRNL